MSPTTRELDRLEQDVGELLGRHESGESLEEFEEYRDEPVRFAVEVLDEDPTEPQREALELLLESDRLAWRSAQAIGKSRTIAVAALWWAYARRGQALLSAPTRRSVEEVLMRKELARLWHANPRLGGDLYTGSLRIERDEPAILAYTATSSSAATGQHDSEGGVLAILDESQGVPPEVWTAMDANTTGARDRQFVCGNPIEPSGDFFEVSQSGSGWATLQTSVFDHPNLDPDADREVPGGPSRAWLERMRDRWGEGSPRWTARVVGEFPESAEDSLIESSWLEASFDRHREGTREREFAVAAVDVARHGSDRSCVCLRRGSRVERFEMWRGTGTMETARRAREELEEAHAEYPVRTVVVDEVGVGGGVLDRLQETLELTRTTPASGLRRVRERSATVKGFQAGERARDHERFVNLASQSFWKLRKLLESGELDLPPEDGLREELLALRREVTSDSRTRVDKSAAKARLGHSPDLADALVMTLEPKLRKAGESDIAFFTG